MAVTDKQIEAVVATGIAVVGDVIECRPADVFHAIWWGGRPAFESAMSLWLSQTRTPCVGGCWLEYAMPFPGEAPAPMPLKVA